MSWGCAFDWPVTTALAKEALNRVLSSAQNSPYGRKSMVVLRSKMPLSNVPQSAEEKNIAAYNLMQSHPRRKQSDCLKN